MTEIIKRIAHVPTTILAICETPCPHLQACLPFWQACTYQEVFLEASNMIWRKWNIIVEPGHDLGHDLAHDFLGHDFGT
jgi:hypothetical protein